MSIVPRMMLMNDPFPLKLRPVVREVEPPVKAPALRRLQSDWTCSQPSDNPLPDPEYGYMATKGTRTGRTPSGKKVDSAKIELRHIAAKYENASVDARNHAIRAANEGVDHAMFKNGARAARCDLVEFGRDFCVGVLQDMSCMVGIHPEYRKGYFERLCMPGGDPAPAASRAPSKASKPGGPVG